MAERYQPPRGCATPATRQRQHGRSPSGGSEGGRARCMRKVRRHGNHLGGRSLFKGNSHTRVLRCRGLSLHQRAQRSSPYDTGAGPHMTCKLAQDRRSQTTVRGACNRPAVTSTPPSSPKPAGERADRHAGSMQPRHGDAPFRLRRVQHGVPGHTSCNRRAGYYVRKTIPPLAPVPRLLDCGTGAAIRGNPAHGPTVPAKHASQGSVSCGRRRDGRYGQKWPDSNGDNRRAEAAVKSTAGSRPLLEQQESPLPRREDDAPMFRSSNGSRMHNDCPTNRSSRRINSTAGQATPLAGEAATLHLRHNDRVKKGAPHRSISYPFPLPLSLSCYKDQERGYSERDPSLRRKRAPSPPIDQRFEGWPLGRVSTAASEHSGFAPSTG
jgi:hypothetical protein